ncbi:hypothetical protein [Sagittula stellata]|uniref:Uncharacterized protein n=1 Tax=Sagittula stellata (strain ATCC 700073 / DSM 11524 / E-37) TaxID=388399 RepID=A3KAP9_SAGS3|nr:hypothetical protein [Sagittula stellata]EBA05755.1 hypothetical protein SSE37_03050 [Sagittula stellata E-37]
MRTAALALMLAGLCAAPLTAQESTAGDLVTIDLTGEDVTGQEPIAPEWKAIVVGQPGPGAKMSFADAFHAGQAIEKGGLPLIDMIRDMPRTRLTDTLAALEDAPRLLLFYSGRIPSGSVSMQDGTMPLDTILRSASVAGTEEMILMLENCTDQTPVPAQVIVPEPPEGMALLVMASAGPGERCEPGERLSDALRAMSEEEDLTGDLLARLDGMFTVGSVPSPVIMTGAPEENDTQELVELLPEDVILLPALDGDFSLGGGGDDNGFEETIGEDEVIEIVLPARVPDLAQDIVENTPVVTFAALPTAQIAALPLAAGLPEPSILVGLIEGITDASLEVDPEPEAESTALASFTNDNAAIVASLATLRELRKNDPGMYASLLASGAFDPPAGDVLAKVIQTELRRMNCYLGGIDGDYGPRSRRGSTSYYGELEKKEIASLDSPDASVDLFRLILGNDDVRCPDPVVAKPRSSTTRSNTARNTSSRSTNTTRTTRSAPAAQAPSRAPTSSPSRSSGGNFSGGSFGGVFR